MASGANDYVAGFFSRSRANRRRDRDIPVDNSAGGQLLRARLNPWADPNAHRTNILPPPDNANMV